MTKNRIINPITIFRFVGVCTALWMLARVALFVNRVWSTAMFQFSDFGRQLTLLNSTAPVVLLALLILLPWRRLSTTLYWTALLFALIIFWGRYFYTTIASALNGNYYVAFINVIIIIQLITILKIRQASSMQDSQNDSLLHGKSILRRKLGAIVVLALIIGAGLDLQHLTWMHSDRAMKLEIMWFTLSVPLVVIAMILLAVIIKPLNKAGCAALCLFSLPVSIVAMYITYRTSIQRYHLGSETGMAIVFGAIPAMIIGLFFALWIYFTCKAYFGAKNI